MTHLGTFSLAALVTGAMVSTSLTPAIRGEAGKTIVTNADFRQAMKDLSNAGRWGADDELGASNFITPAKRKQAAALVKEGVNVSLAHDLVEEDFPEGRSAYGPSRLDRTMIGVTATGAADRYQFTGSYHGSIFSHLDAVNCHVFYEGKGYNGRSWEDVKADGGCPKGSINAQKDGVVTRGILFDATLLPGRAGPEGWLEVGTAIHREDLEALEKIEHVKVAPGDVILLHTGRWKRRAAKGPWDQNAEGLAGYHADVAYFLKDRGVSFIGADGINDVLPSRVEGIRLPLHSMTLASLGVAIFDNLDLGRAADTAKRLNRWEFLFTAAPLRIEKGTGSPLNPTAVF